MPTARNSSRAYPTARPIERPTKGTIRYHVCDASTTLTPGGRLKAHDIPGGGIRCINKKVLHAVKVDAPPVVVPSTRSGAERRPSTEPSRLDAGSECRECGRWLPGERSLCGRCSVLGGAR